MKPFPAVLDPAQLAIMKGALDEFCSRHRIETNSQEHEDLARRIMDLFACGWHSHEELRALLAADRSSDSDPWGLQAVLAVSPQATRKS